MRPLSWREPSGTRSQGRLAQLHIVADRGVPHGVAGKRAPLLKATGQVIRVFSDFLLALSSCVTPFDCDMLFHLGQDELSLFKE